MPYLQTIAAIKSMRLRTEILSYFSKDKLFNNALQELCENIIKGNIEVDSIQRQKLMRNKQNIYKIAFNKRVKKSVSQSGGWMWIIPIVASLLT